MKHDNNPQLNATLGPVLLWGMGVGLVISGMYFGWNLGLAEGGTLGLAIATGFIMLMYVTFTFSYTELACAIPKAGGAFDYADRALGKDMGFIGGMAQIIEFVFAPPAIAAAIGAYFHLYFPTVPTLAVSIAAYALFTALNVAGVKLATTFELVVTVLAVIELLIFAGVTLPHFETANLTKNALPNGYSGAFAAIPFAIWFFLAIEGVANLAEETVNPQRNVLLGFGSAIATLAALCVITFLSAVGVDGWEAVVYPPGSTEPSDSPLPLALSYVVGDNNFLYHLLITVGLLGLIASFHGIILAAGRATFEFGRIRYVTPWVGKVHSRFRTPANALIVNTVVGIIALLTGKTGEIITIACFGALSLYIVSMVSLFVLRRREPELERPFRVPLYPLFPAVALVIASVALVAVTVYNPTVALVYFGIMALAYGYFYFFVKGNRVNSPSELSYRPATADDFEQTLRIKSRSLRPYIEQIWGWDDALQRKIHQQEFAPENTRLLEVQDTVVGYVATKEQEGDLWISNILIDRNFQNQGLGSHVLTHLTDEARTKNQAVGLRVLKVNERAKALYQRLGFKVTGEDELHFMMTKS